MSTYRCDAGHRSERLTECSGMRNSVLDIHVPPALAGTWAGRCDCGKGPDEEVICFASPGKGAPDALIVPPACERTAKLVRCVACDRPSALDYCDDCWSDLQGGYQE